MSPDSPLQTSPPHISTEPLASPIAGPRRRGAGRWFAVAFVLLLLLVAVALVAAHLWVRHAMRASLPQLDGNLHVPGLHAPVTVLRDPRGVPTIRAASLDDLLFAQGFVTAQDRLFQMDTLRRHAAGELAEILGPSLLPHDRSQRLLGIRAAADRATAQLPPDQLHSLQLYSQGVNAAIAVMRPHLPLEFRILGYQPKPWTPRDTMLVSLVMFEDLTNRFPEKLNRATLTARLAPNSPPELRAQLLADLYPVGSWRDHPPSQPVPDLSAPVDSIPQIPLDDSQTKLRNPAPTSSTTDLLALAHTLTPRACAACLPGSNNWAVAGTHTTTGHALLANDMHLSLTVPGIWYQVNLEAPAAPNPSSTEPAEPFHVAGVSLPGAPFVIVGHNAHVAWGFTNLGADVQDVYLEHLRGSGASAEFAAPDGTWHPVLHRRELIQVRGAAEEVLDIQLTRHGDADTPIVSPMLPSEQRPFSLRWVIYQEGSVNNPFFAVDTATDATSLVQAFSAFGGPSQNLVYADNLGHIGYHATGRIPIRGSLTAPSALSEVPTDATGPDAATHEWVGYIPYDQLPQVLDPPGGLLATANSRVTPDGYPFPITDNWVDPYRNERIWKLLAARPRLSPADMLAIQGDIYSDPDRVIAQRLAYAIDHASPLPSAKRLHAAADLLRSWNGRIASDSPAAAIVDATRTALWPLLLAPKLGAAPATGNAVGSRSEPWQLYSWGERAFAEEQLIVHSPARWLPSAYRTWDDLLAAAVDRGLAEAHAPSSLAHWRYGDAHPLVIEHPLFAQSALLRSVVGVPTGITSHAQSGDGTTVKQVGRSFGPSERFTADLGNLDASTLNLVLGQSGNPESPWFLDQFPAWLHLSTFPMPFTDPSTTHTLTLTPDSQPN